MVSNSPNSAEALPQKLRLLLSPSLGTASNALTTRYRRLDHLLTLEQVSQLPNRSPLTSFKRQFTDETTGKWLSAVLSLSLVIRFSRFLARDGPFRTHTVELDLF